MELRDDLMAGINFNGPFKQLFPGETNRYETGSGYGDKSNNLHGEHNE